MFKLITKILPAALVAGVALCSVHRCLACLALGVTPVRIESESAVIVWDKTSQTEHFIRSVNFDTDAPDLGFVVPTPSVPTLNAVDDGAIPALREAMQPTLTGDAVIVTPTSLLMPVFEREKTTASSTSDDEADVVQDKFVDGMEATTLSASDVPGVKKWMQANSYPWSSGIGVWLQSYVVKHWYVTVFKYVKPVATANNIVSKSLDLSFKTSQPFYPYSEPEDMRLMGSYDSDRLLRLYVLGTSRMNAALDANEQNTSFPGRTRSAAPLADDKRDAIASLLKLQPADLPEGAWLTVFDDTSSPRPGYADLSFSPSTDQSQIVLKPIDKRTKHPFYISLDLVAFVLFFVLVIKLRRLQRAGKLAKNGDLIRFASVIGFFVAYVGIVWLSAIYEATP